MNNGNAKAEEEWPSVPIRSMGLVEGVFTAHLQRVEYFFARFSRDVLHKRKMRSGSIGALSLIIENPGTSQNDIVKMTTYDKSAVNVITNGLLKAGLIERETSEADRRRCELFVTPNGLKYLDDYLAEVRQREQRLLAGLSPEDQQKLLELLDKLYVQCLVENTR